MSQKKISTELFPWDYIFGDDNFQKEPWILKKGKEYVTIEKNRDNKGFFYIQKNKEKRLSLNSIQIKSTYNHLIKFGYKFRK
ncbi:cytochrome oxidase [Prochlorococcus sp. AH-716-E13]|nr:cytochrome oxidase [Prochlorococcus sp. AH-716-E13]